MLALASIATLVTMACFYPGYLNGDSNWQYAQGLSGEYDDMHPVVMSWLWSKLDRVVEGSGGLFLLMAGGPSVKPCVARVQRGGRPEAGDGCGHLRQDPGGGSYARTRSASITMVTAALIPRVSVLTTRS